MRHVDVHHHHTCSTKKEVVIDCVDEIGKEKMILDVHKVSVCRD